MKNEERRMKSAPSNALFNGRDSGLPCRVDKKNLHGVAHRKRRQDEQRREGFSLSSAPVKSRLALTFFSILFSLFLFACDTGGGGGGGTGNYKRFDWDIQGTWKTNAPGSTYNGTLVIKYDSITITGYGETQTPALGGNDIERPFRNFTKNIALEGYTEEGKIFIKDAGTLSEGIPYTYWTDNPPPTFKTVEFLRFTFGGRQETLQKQD